MKSYSYLNHSVYVSTINIYFKNLHASNLGGGDNIKALSSSHDEQTFCSLQLSSHVFQSTQKWSTLTPPFDTSQLVYEIVIWTAYYQRNSMLIFKCLRKKCQVALKAKKGWFWIKGLWWFCFSTHVFICSTRTCTSSTSYAFPFIRLVKAK